ncbi:hypothetical protein [Bradyrhizobium sp. 930_D9_N1_4]|uniref:hypothetical protein n=1 Tax=Bradyrhizobium sp. 930_D9_N1_4 TaxID=3240374 RepID=UPI003F8C1572
MTRPIVLFEFARCFILRADTCRVFLRLAVDRKKFVDARLEKLTALHRLGLSLH